MDSLELHKVNTINEHYILAYLMRKPDQLHKFNLSQFLTQSSKLLFTSLRDYFKKNEDFNITSYFVEVKSKDKHNLITIEYLNDIHKILQDFNNIDKHIETLKNDHLKYKLSERVTSELVSNLTSGKLLDAKNLRDTLSKLDADLSDFSENKTLFTTDELVQDFVETRDALKDKKSIGYQALDSMLATPCAPGEITTIVGRTGSGKTSFLKNIENNLFNKNIPVVSFNFEMTSNAIISRLICIRNSTSAEKLTASSVLNASPHQISKWTSSLKNIKSYLYYNYHSTASTTFSQIDLVIYEAKKKFKSLGILQDDEYMVCTFDLVSMIHDFKDRSALDIENAMNKLHDLTRKHNIHSIIVVQANENKYRGKVFSDPSELDSYRVSMEDIKGGSEYANRSRLVITLTRPTFLKRQFFPEHASIFDNDLDILNIDIVKNNNGELFRIQMLFENFKIIQLNPQDAQSL